MSWVPLFSHIVCTITYVYTHWTWPTKNELPGEENHLFHFNFSLWGDLFVKFQVFFCLQLAHFRSNVLLVLVIPFLNYSNILLLNLDRALFSSNSSSQGWSGRLFRILQIIRMKWGRSSENSRPLRWTKIALLQLLLEPPEDSYFNTLWFADLVSALRKNLPVGSNRKNVLISSIYLLVLIRMYV